jgi:hypothetical protein
VLVRAPSSDTRPVRARLAAQGEHTSRDVT